VTALCHHHEDPELWFTGAKTAIAKAKAICERCPVRAGCLAHALEHKIAHGVWGGLTEDERRKILHQRKPRSRKTHPASQSPSKRPCRPSVKTHPPSESPSDVRGVFWHATKGRWVVVIRHRSRMHWAGQFVDQGAAEAAAIARCAELDTSPRR
jgi:WhiB family redox-sensing transcriptional regulator